MIMHNAAAFTIAAPTCSLQVHCMVKQWLEALQNPNCTFFPASNVVVSGQHHVCQAALKASSWQSISARIIWSKTRCFSLSSTYQLGILVVDMIASLLAKMNRSGFPCGVKGDPLRKVTSLRRRPFQPILAQFACTDR
jgi:hypothetical protein